MTHSNKNSVSDDFGIPKGYTFCFQSDCPSARHCACFFAGRHTGDRKIVASVTPAAREGDRCPWYKANRTIRGAWGFDKLFEDVKAKDAHAMRMQIKAYLGGNGTYYRYHRGETLLTPEQQAWIVRLFRHNGYGGDLCFDGYRDAYDW